MGVGGTNQGCPFSDHKPRQGACAKQSLGDLRPAWWPEHIVNMDAMRRNGEE